MQQGKVTKVEGKLETANPYPTGPRPNADWFEGYTCDKAEHNIDAEERASDGTARIR